MPAKLSEIPTFSPEKNWDFRKKWEEFLKRHVTHEPSLPHMITFSYFCIRSLFAWKNENSQIIFFSGLILFLSTAEKTMIIILVCSFLICIFIVLLLPVIWVVFYMIWNFFYTSCVLLFKPDVFSRSIHIHAYRSCLFAWHPIHCPMTWIYYDALTASQVRII